MMSWTINNINFLLPVIILGLILVRPHRAVIIYGFLTNVFIYAYLFLEHLKIVNDYSALPYYGGAALVDYLMIILISRLVNIDSLVIQLQTALRCLIYINLFGWLLWVSYNPPDWYNFLITVMFCYSIYVILTQGKSDNVGVFNMGVRDFVLFTYHRKICYQVQRNEKKART